MSTTYMPDDIRKMLNAERDVRISLLNVCQEEGRWRRHRSIGKT
jgi:hypothetical protein